MLKVLVVDDQALVRRGFALVLQHEADIQVSEASNGFEAIDAAREHKPDIILMDIRMPELDGLEATARLLANDPSLRIIILTTFDPDEYIYRALRAGASGFLLKDTPPETLVAAVRSVAEGGAMLAPNITRRLISQFSQQMGVNQQLAQQLKQLTQRERQVLCTLAEGQNNMEIAASLCISTTTVKSHISSLLSKLDLRDRAQAVVFAYESGLAKVGKMGEPPNNIND